MPPANLAALRHYAHLSHASTAAPTTPPPPSPPTPYDATLTHEIHALRRRLLDEELAASTLRQQLPPTPTPTHPPLRRLAALRKAHDAAFQTLDHVPAASSPLNHLLAHRSLATVIARTTSSLSAARSRLADLSRAAARETADLADHRRLHAALQSRLESVAAEDGGGGGAGDAVEALVRRRRELARRTAAALRELRWFVDARGLARMLAAEGAGGPVVGEAPGAGLQGLDPQRRVDEMWGAGGEPAEVKAAREFMEMLEELMNASLSADPYVPLRGDTAVVRFLVRARVAAFHPKDARRLRLVDFGGCVEDG